MIRHFCLDIEGGIANAKDLKGCIKVDGRTLETVAEVRKFLRSQLAMGRKFLPCGRCSNFDYQTGRKGHEHPEQKEAGKTERRKEGGGCFVKEGGAAWACKV